MKTQLPDENDLFIRPDYTQCSCFVFLGLSKKYKSLSVFQPNKNYLRAEHELRILSSFESNFRN